MTFSIRGLQGAEYTQAELPQACRHIGGTLATARVYLTGRVELEVGDRLISQRDWPGRQGRLAFVYLAANRAGPLTRNDLTDVLWPDQAPRDPEGALSAVLSKLRSTLRRAGLAPQQAGLDVHAGVFSLRLPSDTIVDLETATMAIDEAEGALRAGDLPRAWGHANVVVNIARRPFLPDHEAPWIETHRAALRALRCRGLQCLAAASAAGGEAPLAVSYVGEMLTLEPFRETAFQALMRLHAAAGNRAEALRVFERCRTLLRDELGTSPSPQTEAVFLEILRANN